MGVLERTTVRKQVVVANDWPEDVLARAQVLIVAGERWHTLGAGRRAHGTWGVEEVKKLVRCPVIDVSEVPDYLDEKMGEVIRATVDERIGVFNLSGLVSGLAALGGSVKLVGKENGHGREG